MSHTITLFKRLALLSALVTLLAVVAGVLTLAVLSRRTPSGPLSFDEWPEVPVKPTVGAVV